MPGRQPSTSVQEAPLRPPKPFKAPKPPACSLAALHAARRNESSDSSGEDLDGDCVPATIEQPAALARDPADSLHAARKLDFPWDAGMFLNINHQQQFCNPAKHADPFGIQHLPRSLEFCRAISARHPSCKQQCHCTHQGDLSHVRATTDPQCSGAWQKH